MSLLILFLAAFLLVCLYDLLLGWAVKKRLTCERHFSVPKAYAGQEIEMIEIVRNDSPLMIPWLRLESRISPWLKFRRSEEVDIHGDMYHCSLFTLMPYQQITRRHKVRLLKRGIYDIGNATLTVGDLLGFHRVISELHGKARMVVYPEPPAAHDLPSLLSRQTGGTVVPFQLQRDPFLIRGLRAYQPGDPVRDIHWAATAKTGETSVKLHDPTSDLQLLVVVNSQLREDQWDDLMDYEQMKIEYLLSVAAALCRQTIRSGLPAGFTGNLRIQDEKESVMVVPSCGPLAEEKMLFAMAALKITKTEQFNHFLEQLPARIRLDGMDILILSLYDSPALQERITMLRRRGASVQLRVVTPAGKGGAA